MTSDLNRRWINWLLAIEYIRRGSQAMSWFRKGSEEEDKMVASANGVILDTLSDADTVKLIEGSTKKNLRDQVTVEQATELNRERELRGFSRRN